MASGLKPAANRRTRDLGAIIKRCLVLLLVAGWCGCAEPTVTSRDSGEKEKDYSDVPLAMPQSAGGSKAVENAKKNADEKMKAIDDQLKKAGKNDGKAVDAEQKKSDDQGKQSSDGDPKKTKKSDDQASKRWGSRLGSRNSF